jgi:hypothetical protein
MRWPRLVLVATAALVLVAALVARADDAAAGAGAARESFARNVDRADLPPAPSEVLHWSALDVERWMSSTIGYPELATSVRTYLIDGPTLLSMDVDGVFRGLHPAQSAKLRAHQQLLRGQCVCDSARVVDVWAFLRYSAASTAFHATSAALSPRVGVLSALFFDRGLLCCTIGGASQLDADAEAAALLARSVAGGTVSDGGGGGGGVERVLPCGLSRASCDASPGWLTLALSLVLPWSVMLWHVLRAAWVHPFFAAVWAPACVSMQLSEAFMLYRFYRGVHGGHVTVREIVLDELRGFASPFFFVPLPLSLLVGYFLPHWASYVVLLALTALAASNVASFTWHIVTSFFGGEKPAANEDETKSR